MCTFENEHSVVVCDIAIQQVRAAVSGAFGDGIRYTPIAGQGTRVEAKLSIDEEAFQEVARSAIAAAQQKPSKKLGGCHNALRIALPKQRT